MYCENIKAPFGFDSVMEGAMDDATQNFKIKVDFREISDRIVGIATLDTSTGRFAALEYGESPSDIFKSLLRKLSLQLSDGEIFGLETLESFQ